jgi:hypothetical protein
MTSNIAIKITADVADLTAKRAVMSAELKAATKDLNDLAKASRSGMTDELKAKMLAAATAVAKTRAELAQLNGEMAKLGKEGNAAALANIWGNLKNSALEEGAAKLGPLGAGLEALGPAGLAAAAGVAAVVGAFEGIEKTAEWAEQLERASNTLGLTTTKLQEFDFIAASIGIPVDRMRESMAGLARTVGLVQSGFARSMQTKAFTDALHISPEDLRSWGDLEHQLPHIIEAFSRLDPETRAGLAQRLKMDPEVLTALVGAKDRLGDLIDEAHRFGIVMDEETVKKSAAAAEKLHVLSAVIEGEARVAFANFAPAVSAGAGGLAHFVGETADVVRGVGVVLAPIGELIKLLGGVPAVAHATGDALINMVPGLKQVVELLGFLRNEGAKAREAADAAAKAGEHASQGPKPVKLTSGNAKGPSIVSQWSEQLHAQEIASGEFFKDQTAHELAFWQSKLAVTKAGSKDWLEVQDKIYQAQKALAHQAYEEHVADLNDRLAADRNSWVQEQADWTEKLAYIGGKYGEQSTQYKTAHKEFLAAEREHQKQLTEIAKSGEQERLAELQNTLKTEALIRKSNASLAEAKIGQNARGSASPVAEVTAAAQLAALHRQLNQQELADLEALYAKEDNLRTQAVVDNLHDYGEESVQYHQAVDAKKKADADFFNQHRALQTQMVNESKQDSIKVQQAWANAVQPMVSSFGSGIKGLIKGTETLSQALQNVGETILDVIITAIERWVTAQIVAMITGQAAGKTAAAGQVATNIALAGSGGVASMAAAPFPIDLTAPAFGAAMAAQAAAFGAVAAFDKGTNLVPADMFALIHEGERIVPKADNTALMSAVRGSGGGSGGGDLHYHDNTSVTGHGLEDVIDHLARRKTDVLRLFGGWARGGHFAPVLRAAGVRG